MKKLIIWDFDGVIADTEKLWVDVWHETINKKFNLNWDFETAYNNFAGISVKTKVEKLAKIGIYVDDILLQEIVEKEIDVMHKEMKITKDITNIIENKKIKHCIATGGIKDKTFKKIKILGLDKYFSKNNVFTADMVKHGKPEPDLFLFAAKMMGFELSECVVIEDSYAGITAAQKASIDVVAFVEHQKIDQSKFVYTIKNMGISKIAYDAKELKNIIGKFK